MCERKFKVGDRVRTLERKDKFGYYRFRINNTIGIIIEIDNKHDKLPYKVSNGYDWYWYDEYELELVQSAEVGPVPIHNNIDISLRPCMVGERKGKFHKWIDEQKILIKFNTYLKSDNIKAMTEEFKLSGVIPPHTDYEIITNTVALVEFEDGSVKKVDPEEVRFVVLED